jgi:very-short-patch-repair endonuclease
MAKVASKTLYRARRLRRRLTNAETILWSELRRSTTGLRFRRQHPIGPYIADFACICARLIIEVDGATHSSEAECAHDARRDAYLKARGWQVIRVSNDDVYRSLEDTLNYVCNSAIAQAGRKR